jgi:hypothetical protein
MLAKRLHRLCHDYTAAPISAAAAAFDSSVAVRPRSSWLDSIVEYL